jgi:hypothetical protein
MISNKKRKILYVSNTYEGAAHDYGILQIEFPSHLKWFNNFTVVLDLGFQGFLDLYPCKKLIIPVKKKRKAKGVKHELTQPEIQHNKEVSKERIFVEHSIGGMKRYRILEHRNRLKKQGILNQVIGVCAALWNYTIDI